MLPDALMKAGEGGAPTHQALLLAEVLQLQLGVLQLLRQHLLAFLGLQPPGLALLQLDTQTW